MNKRSIAPAQNVGPTYVAFMSAIPALRTMLRDDRLDDLASYCERVTTAMKMISEMKLTQHPDVQRIFGKFGIADGLGKRDVNRGGLKNLKKILFHCDRETLHRRIDNAALATVDESYPPPPPAPADDKDGKADDHDDSGDPPGDDGDETVKCDDADNPDHDNDSPAQPPPPNPPPAAPPSDDGSVGGHEDDGAMQRDDMDGDGSGGQSPKTANKKHGFRHKSCEVVQMLSA